MSTQLNKRYQQALVEVFCYLSSDHPILAHFKSLQTQEAQVVRLVYVSAANQWKHVKQ